jgi:anti-sigma-K factor RskA
MSDNTGYIAPPDDNDPQAIAMDVALGLVREDEVEPATIADPAFQVALADWRTRLASLDDTATPIAPSPMLWPKLSTSLALSQATPQPEAQVRTAPARIQPPRPSIGNAEPGFLMGLWENLSFWRGVGFAGAAASVALAAGLVVMSERASRKPIFVAVLMTEQNETAAIVNAFADGTAELVPTRNFAVPAGKAIEIWTLWDRQVGPRSIGLIEKARTIKLDLRHLPKTKSGQLFEMTLEPSTGSPTGRPTGPILTKGATEVAL